jgi:hypothetical protein
LQYASIINLSTFHSVNCGSKVNDCAPASNVWHHVNLLVQNEAVYRIRVAKAVGWKNDGMALWLLLICTTDNWFTTQNTNLS